MYVRERIEKYSAELTTTERRLCSALLLDYPFFGLEPINELAGKVNASPPSISRFVTKLGFNGFQEFQRQLIEELKEGQRSPVELQKISKPFEGAYLSSFLERAEKLVKASALAISDTQFDIVCNLLADEKRSIYLVGGRMSDPLVQYLSRHLQQARDKIHHLPENSEKWPDFLLKLRPKDVVFIADFRRYQPVLEKLAQKAHSARKAQIILLTDQWLSPISAYSAEVLAVPIDSNTLWDSYSGAFAVIEAIVTHIAESNWKTTKTRIEAWDEMRLEFGEENHDI